MAIRFAAASGLALAAALIVAAPARAQGFFGLFEMSPRQVVGMIEDDGYRLRGPLVRRGDVYVCDVTSITGRSVRLIVSARDGRVLERFASAPRWRDADPDEDAPRARRPRDYADDDRDSDDDYSRRRDMALGDVFTPPSRVYGNDSLFGSKPTPPASVPDAAPAKPRSHAARKHKEPAIAKAPAPEPVPADAQSRPADAGSSVAAVAPSAAPEPKKPAVEPVKPAAPVETPRPAAEAKPTPGPTQTQAEADKRPAEVAPVKAKPEKPQKKINDLPVGTLD